MDEVLADSNDDPDVLFAKQFIDRIYRGWNIQMNLYTHNCQHFSDFVYDMLKDERICRLE